jgi:hypothetical protein
VTQVGGEGLQQVENITNLLTALLLPFKVML